MERLIHEMGVQKTFAMAHRQVWCWQDEWVDLTLSDIRRLEAETAQYLQKVMQGELDSIPAIKIPSLSNESEVIGPDQTASTSTLEHVRPYSML